MSGKQAPAALRTRAGWPLGAALAATLLVLLVALVVYTLASMTPLTRWEPWVASRTVPWMHVLLEGLKPMLPDSVSQYVPETV